MKQTTVHSLHEVQQHLQQLQPAQWVTVVQFGHRYFIWQGLVDSPHDYIYCGIAGNYSAEDLAA